MTLWIQLYGPPEILQSDNGREFKGAVERLLLAWGIKIKHGKPRTPQVQGLVEQANGVVQSGLAKWKTEWADTAWDTALPNIALGINRTKHSATLKTPYEIVFGRPYPHHVHLSVD
jgi:transposase InsO family protein